MLRFVRFEGYQVDLRTGELRKNGTKIRLSGQPFQILAFLLEKPGELVTREELRTRLWPDEVFVDFDHSLNAAVNKLREALSDSTGEARFVETLPKRGYRFIAPIEPPDEPARHQSAANSSGPIPSDANQEATQRAWSKIRITGLRYAALTLVGALLASVTLLGYGLKHRATPRVLGSAQLTNDAQRKTALYAGELAQPLVSDGSRLFFTECTTSGARLAEVSTRGGETTLFPADLHIRRVLDISAERHELLALVSEGVQLDSAAIVVPLPAGTPHRLGDVVAHDASWSPDGKRLVYASANDLYVSDGGGSKPRKLTEISDGGTAWWPRWSPDGSAVRFTVHDRFGAGRLWEISTDGSRAHPLFSDGSQPRDECCGSWTRDGKYFVFQSEGQLRAIRQGAGFISKESTQLTTGPMTMVAPVPSPDGQKIFSVAVQQRGQLVRYDQRSRQFVPILSGVSADGVDFSRDGQWVTYALFPEGTLWRSRADGSERLQLTLPPMRVTLPRWSPDGRRVAFLGETVGKPTKIYIISADGGIPSQAMPGERNEGEPSWSPDGDTLAFAPLYWLGESTAIRFLDLKTGKITTLPGSEGLFSVRWSPDGRHLAALKADSSQTLMLFDIATQKWNSLKENAAYPNWSRDGNYIYFEDPYSSEQAIYRARISDRRIELVTTLNSRILTWTTAEKWTGLAADDSPLVLRDTSVDEIYAFDWEAP